MVLFLLLMLFIVNKFCYQARAARVFNFVRDKPDLYSRTLTRIVLQKCTAHDGYNIPSTEGHGSPCCTLWQVRNKLDIDWVGFCVEITGFKIYRHVNIHEISLDLVPACDVVNTRRKCRTVEVCIVIENGIIGYIYTPPLCIIGINAILCLLYVILTDHSECVSVIPSGGRCELC